MNKYNASWVRSLFIVLLVMVACVAILLERRCNRVYKSEREFVCWHDAEVTNRLSELDSGARGYVGSSAAFVFKERPAIGVALGTAVTDLLILVFLVSVTWKWIKKAIFNFNSLKILGAAAVVTGLTFLLRDPVYNFALSFDIGTPAAMIIELVGVVLIDAIVYLVILGLLKEDLVHSFLRKKENDA